MQKITFTKKVVGQAAAAGAAAVVLILFGVSQKTGIGQSYRSVMVNGTYVGSTTAGTDVSDVIHEVRREMAAEADGRLCMDYEWESKNDRRLFQKLMSEDELKEALKETLKETVIHNKERAYTVAIEGYRANFKALEDVYTFLDRVKASLDENGQFRTQIAVDEGQHISGIWKAYLAETSPEDEKQLKQGEKQSGLLTAGVSAAVFDAMEYALLDPSGGSYETGILDMEFVEKVAVYENYVDMEELSDIDTEVAEVTKEKESNKIYVVESGDCISVIAMDHDTTVSSIVALNGLSNPDAIRDGQELIIAVPEPDLKLRLTMGEVYEEDYTAEPVIKENDSWYTTKEVVWEEGTTGHRERNDVVVYENGMEVSRKMVRQKVITESKAAVIERGTIIPPTYVKPISGGRYTSGFGRRWGRLHKGVDWACPVGTKVFASCGGTVIQASYNGGYGNNVVISHPDGRLTRYAHNSKLLVRVGQHVEQGEVIALSGNTGRSTGPHVHFEIYINGAAVNPLKYIGN